MSKLPPELKCFDITDPSHPKYAGSDGTPITEPMPHISREDAIVNGLERLRLRWNLTELEFRALCDRWARECGGE